MVVLLHPQRTYHQMIPIRRLPYIGLCTVILVLDGCSLGGMGGPYPEVQELVSASSVPRYSGPSDPARVLYRIDKDRAFEDAATHSATHQKVVL